MRRPDVNRSAVEEAMEKMEDEFRTYDLTDDEIIGHRDWWMLKAVLDEQPIAGDAASNLDKGRLAA